MERRYFLSLWRLWLRSRVLCYKWVITPGVRLDAAHSKCMPNGTVVLVPWGNGEAGIRNSSSTRREVGLLSSGTCVSSPLQLRGGGRRALPLLGQSVLSVMRLNHYHGYWPTLGTIILRPTSQTVLGDECRGQSTFLGVPRPSDFLSSVLPWPSCSQLDELERSSWNAFEDLGA